VHNLTIYWEAPIWTEVARPLCECLLRTIIGVNVSAVARPELTVEKATVVIKFLKMARDVVHMLGYLL